MNSGKLELSLVNYQAADSVCGAVGMEQNVEKVGLSLLSWSDGCRYECVIVSC